MGRRKKWPPTVTRHKGRARIRIDGHDIQLGAWGSEEAEAERQRIVRHYEDTGDVPAPAKRRRQSDSPLVCELVERYLVHAEAVFPKKHVNRIKRALGGVLALYAELPSDQFGPRCLKAVQIHFCQVQPPLCRTYVNYLSGAIRQAWKWLASEELVSVEASMALFHVADIPAGRSPAPGVPAPLDNPPVEGVDPAAVEATIPHLSRQVAGLVRVQQWTGCRPGEACSLCAADLDQDGLDIDGVRVWVWRPGQHKGAWRGHRRQILIGPRLQSLLTPFLKGRAPEAALFSPREAVEEYRAANDLDLRHGRNRVPGEAYTTGSYDHAVLMGCRRRCPDCAKVVETAKKASPKKRAKRPKRVECAWCVANCWTPNQLRHSMAAWVDERHDLATAKAVLGHRGVAMTAHYAGRGGVNVARIMADLDLRSAAAVLARIG